MNGHDRFRFRREAPLRPGQPVDPVRDLADYDQMIDSMPADHPGLPSMLRTRETLAEWATEAEPQRSAAVEREPTP